MRLEAQGSLQSRIMPQFSHRILHFRSSIGAPHRSHTYSLASGASWDVSFIQSQ